MLIVIVFVRGCAGAERIWPPSGAVREHWQESEAQPNGEGVAAGSATENVILDFLRKCVIMSAVRLCSIQSQR